MNKMDSTELRTIEPELRDLITALVKAYVRGGGKWKHLSVITGISGTSLRKLADQETVYPRFHTIEAVLNGFGREIALVGVSPVGGVKEVRNVSGEVLSAGLNRLGDTRRSPSPNGRNKGQSPTKHH